MRDGFVTRYDTSKGDDGLPPGEGAFLPCTFWLADNYALLGQHDKARELFDRLAGCATTWACCPKSTTPRRSGWSATFRRRFRTSAW